MATVDSNSKPLECFNGMFIILFVENIKNVHNVSRQHLSSGADVCDFLLQLFVRHCCESHQPILVKVYRCFVGKGIRDTVDVLLLFGIELSVAFFLLLAILSALMFVVRLLTCLIKLVESLQYDHRVYRSVEPSVSAKFEPMTKEHKLCKVVVRIGFKNHFCEFFVLPLAQFTFAPGELG